MRSDIDVLHGSWILRHDDAGRAAAGQRFDRPPESACAHGRPFRVPAARARTRRGERGRLDRHQLDAAVAGRGRRDRGLRRARDHEQQHLARRLDDDLQLRRRRLLHRGVRHHADPVVQHARHHGLLGLGRRSGRLHAQLDRDGRGKLGLSRTRVQRDGRGCDVRHRALHAGDRQHRAPDPRVGVPHRLHVLRLEAAGRRAARDRPADPPARDRDRRLRPGRDHVRLGVGLGDRQARRAVGDRQRSRLSGEQQLAHDQGHRAGRHDARDALQPWRLHRRERDRHGGGVRLTGLHGDRPQRHPDDVRGHRDRQPGRRLGMLDDEPHVRRGLDAAHRADPAGHRSRLALERQRRCGSRARQAPTRRSASTRTPAARAPSPRRAPVRSSRRKACQ